jgi:hypothetical protein
VYLSDQKLPVLVPRVRDRREGKEVRLRSFERLWSPSLGLFENGYCNLELCRFYLQLSEMEDPQPCQVTVGKHAAMPSEHGVQTLI